jgi:hypothetical protein
VFSKSLKGLGNMTTVFDRNREGEIGERGSEVPEPRLRRERVTVTVENWGRREVNPAVLNCVSGSK